MGASRADDHGLAVPDRAVGRHVGAGARGLRGGRQRGRGVRAGDDDRQRRRAGVAGAGGVRARRSRSSSSGSTTRGCATPGRSTPTATTASGSPSISGSTPGARSSRALTATPRSAPRSRGMLGDRVVDGGMVLEGGSMLTNGAGTLLTTEQCLLHPNRNPSLDREQIESLLAAALGVETVRVAGAGAGRGPGHRRSCRPDRGVHCARPGAAADRRARQPQLRQLRGERAAVARRRAGRRRDAAAAVRRRGGRDASRAAT